MLQAGGEAFVARLKELGKRAGYMKVEKVMHGWDKLPKIMAKGEKGEHAERKIEEAYKKVGEWVGTVLQEESQ